MGHREAPAWAGLRALQGPAEGKAAPAVLGLRYKQCRGQLDYPGDEAVYFYFWERKMVRFSYPLHDVWSRYGCIPFYLRA